MIKDEHYFTVASEILSHEQLIGNKTYNIIVDNLDIDVTVFYDYDVNTEFGNGYDYPFIENYIENERYSVVEVCIYDDKGCLSDIEFDNEYLEKILNNKNSIN